MKRTEGFSVADIPTLGDTDESVDGAARTASSVSEGKALGAGAGEDPTVERPIRNDVDATVPGVAEGEHEVAVPAPFQREKPQRAVLQAHPNPVGACR
jgi:hypothetical protein